MLVELFIRNFAVIESVRVQFGRGFHVLTGETGAGKSMIIDALGLIVGGRGSAEWVRYGCDKAEIEALFEVESKHPLWDVLQNMGIDASAEEHLVVRREITIQGKSTCRINGQLANLTMLREVGEWLVNIHGQHEHQSLLKTDRHLEWLDLYGETDILTTKTAYEHAYHAYIQTSKEMHELEKKSKNMLQMIDLYQFQAKEIQDAQLKQGEDELLFEEKRKLANAEKMMLAVSDAYSALYGNTKSLDLIAGATEQLEEIAKYDVSILQPLHEQIQSAFYQLEDAAFQLRDYREQIEINPVRLDQIEQRLDLFNRLQKKYGSSTEDVLQHLAKIQQELETIEHKDELMRSLQMNLDEQLVNVRQLACTLSEKRRAVAKKLAAQVESELRDLHMERTRFEVNFGPVDEHKFTIKGWDQVEFLISANPGQPLRSLSKVASGGELSRMMLALKSIFARVDRIPVLVFDEVDTGVSGRAAQAIAEKLSRLSAECQVFSITHLSQVACMADAHYAIEKSIEGERTYTQVSRLMQDQRVAELARMLGGVEVTETTLHHAAEMLKLAEDQKIRL